MLRNRFSSLLALASAALLAPGALAAVPVQWYQSFEDDTSGWTDGIQGAADFGAITRVSGPLAPYKGAFYAEITQGTTGTQRFSPSTNWGGFATTFPTGGFSTTIAVYLSPSTWTQGNGFDFSSAINTNGGSLRSDYYFHVATQANGDLLVGADTATSFAPRLDLASSPNFKVTTDGWYILEHVFRDNGSGVLAVDMNLLSSGGSLLFSRTINNAAHTIATTGGNRYGWFSFTRQTTSIDHAVIPAPGAFALLGVGGLVAARRRRA